ncbi:hypothetical protein BuS5_00538 [Desulfosarcina sp. BuS5]|nr:hypothetical protein BuS5_00538 [Desulfosarcina sp. BuS5]
MRFPPYGLVLNLKIGNYLTIYSKMGIAHPANCSALSWQPFLTVTRYKCNSHIIQQ